MIPMSERSVVNDTNLSLDGYNNGEQLLFSTVKKITATTTSNRHVVAVKNKKNTRKLITRSNVCMMCFI